eukprot:m.259586 g.259586  ORF g.259586 m.259586 type:complete len:86 (-) comp38322_c0_seq1:131-388(-)
MASAASRNVMFAASQSRRSAKRVDTDLGLKPFGFTCGYKAVISVLVSGFAVHDIIEYVNHTVTTIMSLVAFIIVRPTNTNEHELR